VRTRLGGADGEGKVVELARRRPEPAWSLPDRVVAAFSEAIRAVEPRSADYWLIFDAYVRACGERR
jgi:hypothetical protein